MRRLHQQIPFGMEMRTNSSRSSSRYENLHFHNGKINAKAIMKHIKGFIRVLSLCGNKTPSYQICFIIFSSQFTLLF